MSDLPDELPSDPAELRVFAAALLDRRVRLERLLKLAKDAQFGRSSEKLDADQLQLVLEDIEEAVAALEAAEDRANPKTCEKRTAERRTNRGQVPEHLPRIVEILMPAATCCPCCKGDLVETGRDEVRGSTSFRRSIASSSPAGPSWPAAPVTASSSSTLLPSD